MCMMGSLWLFCHMFATCPGTSHCSFPHDTPLPLPFATPLSEYWAQLIPESVQQFPHDILIYWLSTITPFIVLNHNNSQEDGGKVHLQGGGTSLVLTETLILTGCHSITETALPAHHVIVTLLFYEPYYSAVFDLSAT